MEEKILTPKSGFPMLFLALFMTLGSIAGIVCDAIAHENEVISTIIFVVILILCFLILISTLFIFSGLKLLSPNEALVFVLFGKYYGTVKKEGYYFVNPFVSAVKPKNTAEQHAADLAAMKAGQLVISSNKVSLKATTLNNRKQKINDKLGNPLEIGVMVIWKVVNPTLALFAVDDYRSYVSIQADSVLRNVIRNYAYDVAETEGELTLRSSSTEIADILKDELQEKIHEAGLEALEVKIIDMAYAPEIAASMLQRQQAAALLDAKKLIVEGAVGMVKMALDSLETEGVVNLDEERKATMVSNLLVVLCGSKDTQPIVNTGSLY